MFVDMALPFGLRSAPLLFTAVAYALQWAIEERGVTWVGHYIDDWVPSTTPSISSTTPPPIIHHSPSISSTTPPPYHPPLPLHIIIHSPFISSTTPPPYHPPLPFHIHHSPSISSTTPPPYPGKQECAKNVCTMKVI